MKIDRRTTEGKKMLENIDFSTQLSKRAVSDKIQYVSKMILDTQRTQREKSHECIYCFYKTLMAGSAMTSFECKLCGKESLHHCTATPDFCNECAEDNSICRRCGSELYGTWEVTL